MPPDRHAPNFYQHSEASDYTVVPNLSSVSSLSFIQSLADKIVLHDIRLRFKVDIIRTTIILDIMNKYMSMGLRRACSYSEVPTKYVIHLQNSINAKTLDTCLGFS